MTDLYRIKDLQGNVYNVADAAARADLAALAAKIPAAATADNQLADKAYVAQQIDAGGIVVPAGMIKGVEGAFVAAVPGLDYQTPLEAGTDYQTPLEAGTDYQTPLEAGTDYQTPLAEGSSGNYLSPAHVNSTLAAKLNRSSSVTEAAETPAGAADWDDTEEAVITLYMARGEAFAETDTTPEVEGQICWTVI